jgi:hypothetical protein
VSSKGALVLGVLPMAAVGLGETAPGDESMREAVQRRDNLMTVQGGVCLCYGSTRGW